MEIKEKITVKQFKDGSQNWWVSYFHYSLINGTPTFVCGGIEDEQCTVHFKKYLKTKKLI